MSTSMKLDKDDGEMVDEKMRQGMIGSLLYLRTSRPNVILSVENFYSFLTMS